MKAVGIFVALALSFGGFAHADGTMDGSVMTDVDGQTSVLPDLSQEDLKFDLVQSPGVEEIVGMGIKIWNLIVDNSVASNLSNDVSHALPRGVSSPELLTGWKSAESDIVTTNFTDPIKMTPVSFQYKLLFSYDGKYKNKGHYLENVTLFPVNLRVLAPYNMQAQVEVLSALNVGSSANPVAALRVQLKMKVKDMILRGEQWKSTLFTVDGEGHWTAENAVPASRLDSI